MAAAELWEQWRTRLARLQLAPFRPYLLDSLRHYDRASFLKDLSAGATVGVVALPLAMAFGIASGAKPEQGLFTAIIAGFLISALGGSRVQVGGPAGAFVVIIYGIIAAVRLREPADLDHVRRRAAVRHGTHPPRVAGALHPGIDRHRIHQRHRGSDHRVATQRSVGAFDRPACRPIFSSSCSGSHNRLAQPTRTRSPLPPRRLH